MSKAIAVGGYSRRSTIRDEDFEEEDVWSVVKERGEEEDSSSSPNKYYTSLSSSSSSSSSSSACQLPSVPRMIPTKTTSTHEASSKVVQQSSAPMNIPDWSKIYGSIGYDHHKYYNNGVVNGNDYGDGDGDDDDDDGMVPPHEWLARKLARSQISSFSVCEGIGRTLKGRDLSRVRNAVLTKTGFLE